MPLPHHLSEASFRVYEPHIARALKNWPKETQFTEDDFRGADGQKLSGNTFVARFRDAIASFLTNVWSSDMVDFAKLRELASRKAFAVAHDVDGSVWFRERGHKGRPSVHTQKMREQVAASALPVSVPWEKPTPEELHAVSLLLSNARIPGPVVVSGILTSEVILTLETTFIGLAIVVDNERSVTVINY